MSDKEMVQMLIDQLISVRRAKDSDDPMRELEYQEKILTVKLEAMGITVSDLPHLK
ncbi:MAG: hypothetical protein IJ123_00430 [Blautia sp.]|nr:hypothetical protein [Blautia sp.]